MNSNKFKKRKLNPIVFLTVFLFLLSSCSNNKPQYFDTILDEPCMIVNTEQDNTIEGHYLRVESVENQDSIYKLKINLPENFYISKKNCSSWILGVGDEMPYYDAGVENLWNIKDIDSQNSTISICKCLRGNKIPKVNQKVVFWNTCPSGFTNYEKNPILNEEQWVGFNGNEVYFGAIDYDSILNHYFMIFNEASNKEIHTYLAFSDNLVNWYPANNGYPILTANDFKNTTWAGTDITSKFKQTPYSSSIIRHEGKWYLFLYGFKNGQRQVGLAIADSTVLGPYQILKDPVVANGEPGSWDEKACLSARVAAYKDEFIMFYNAIDNKGKEQLGMARSKDLLVWQKFEKNPILSNDDAWRSCDKVAEPNYVEIRGDSIFIIVLGAKKFKDGLWYRHISKNAYMDKSGNVDDNQYGFYLSIDGGKTLIPHINNPIFTNDYSNIFENSHLGGGFKYIKTDTSEFLIYQAKTSHNDMGYNIMIRERKSK